MRKRTLDNRDQTKAIIIILICSPKKTYRLLINMKRCSTSLIMRKLQITTIVRYHLTPVRRTVIKNLQIITAREGVEKREASYIVGGNGNRYSCYRRQYGDSLKS